MIHKLKSYLQQTKVYHNQSLKEYRETVEKFEHLSSRIPGVLFKEIFVRDSRTLLDELTSIRGKLSNELTALEIERNSYEKALRPNLGHPNNLSILEILNENELKRQDKYKEIMKMNIKILREIIERNASIFYKELTQNIETYLLKFDEILTIDDIEKNGKFNFVK